MEILSLKHDEEFTSQSEYETRIAAIVSRELRQQRREVLDHLQDPPSMDMIPESLWTNAADRLRRSLAPVLELAAAAALGENAERLPLDIVEAKAEGDPRIVIDWLLINQSAADFAASYTFELVKGIEETSRAWLQTEIARFYEDGLTLGELTDRVAAFGDLEDRIANAPIFGPVRAQMIATTETTRAAAAGVNILTEQLRKAGIRTVKRWITNNDEIVRRCPICWPLHNTNEDEAGGFKHPDSGRVYEAPPAHVNCRCWIVNDIEDVNTPRQARFAG